MRRSRKPATASPQIPLTPRGTRGSPKPSWQCVSRMTLAPSSLSRRSSASSTQGAPSLTNTPPRMERVRTGEHTSESSSPPRHRSPQGPRGTRGSRARHRGEQAAQGGAALSPAGLPLVPFFSCSPADTPPSSYHIASSLIVSHRILSYRAPQVSAHGSRLAHALGRARLQERSDAILTQWRLSMTAPEWRADTASPLRTPADPCGPLRTPLLSLFFAPAPVF